MAALPADDLDPPLAYLRSASVVYELEDPETQIGRGDHNDISLDTKSVSGTHARINIHPHKKVAKLIDLGSTNGTFVDEIRVTDSSAPLKHGSVIRFGYDKEQYTFDFHDMPSPRGVLNEHAPQPPVTSARSHTPAAGKATLRDSPPSSQRAGQSSRSNHSSGVASAMDFSHLPQRGPRDDSSHRAPGRSASVPPRERPASQHSVRSSSGRQGMVGRSLSEQRSRLAQRAAARQEASQDLRRTIQEAKRAVAAAAESYESGRGAGAAFDGGVSASARGGGSAAPAPAPAPASSSARARVRASHPEEHFARKRQQESRRDIPHSVVFPGAAGVTALSGDGAGDSSPPAPDSRRVRHAPSNQGQDSDDSDLELSSSFGGIIREAAEPSARSSTRGNAPGAAEPSARSHNKEGWQPQAEQPAAGSSIPGNITIQSFNGNLITGGSGRDAPDGQLAATGTSAQTEAPQSWHMPPSAYSVKAPSSVPQLMDTQMHTGGSASAPQLAQSTAGQPNNAHSGNVRASHSSGGIPEGIHSTGNWTAAQSVPTASLHVPAVSPFLPPRQASPSPFLANSAQEGRTPAGAGGGESMAALQNALYDAEARAVAAESTLQQLSLERATGAQGSPPQGQGQAAAQLTHARLRIAQLESENTQLVSQVSSAQDEAAVAVARLEQAEALATGGGGGGGGGMVGDMLAATNEARATADATAQQCSIAMLASVARAWRRRQLSRCWGRWMAAAASTGAQRLQRDASEREAALVQELAHLQAQVDALSKTSDWGSEVLRLRRELSATREALARKDQQLARQRALFAHKAVARVGAHQEEGAAAHDTHVEDSELELAVQAAVGGWRFQRAALQAMVAERETQIHTLLQAVAAASVDQPHRKRTSKRSQQRRASAQVLVEEAVGSQQAAAAAKRKAGALRGLLSRMRREGRAHMQKSNARIVRLRRWLRRARRQLQRDHDDDVSLSTAPSQEGLGHASDACSLDSSSDRSDSGSGGGGSTASSRDRAAVSLPETCFGSVTASQVDSLGRPGSRNSGSSGSSSGGSDSGNDSSGNSRCSAAASAPSSTGSQGGGHGIWDQEGTDDTGMRRRLGGLECSRSPPAPVAAAVGSMPALLDRLLQSQLKHGASVPTAPPLGVHGHMGHGAPSFGAAVAWDTGGMGGLRGHLQYPTGATGGHAAGATGAPLFPLLQPASQQPLPPHLRGQLPAGLQGPLRPSSAWG